MEFWGVEVKSGQKHKVKPEFGKLVHISQASLGEFKNANGAKNVRLSIKIDDKDLVIGFLSAEERPQVMFDLVFQKEFELSHEWKEGSVYFMGYVADEPESDDEDFSSEPEDDLVGAMETGNVKHISGGVKPPKGVGSDGGSSSSDDELPPNGIDEEDSSDLSGDESDEFSESSEEEVELPKVQQSKKRPDEAAQKAPFAKKAKPATPDNSGNKKGHNATPFPSKGAAGKKSNEHPPKSAGNNKKGQFQNKFKRGGK